MHGENIVFVRGTGRCGSKTLAGQLTRHPQLTLVPVNQCLPEELIDWSLYRLRGVYRRKVTEATVAASCRAYFDAFCRSVTSDLHGSASGSTHNMLVQKSTMNMHRAGELLEYWPQARLVYMIRHPLGVVPAYINVDIAEYDGRYGYNADVANSLLRWANELLAYLRSPLVGHPRVMTVHFEDMVRDPAAFFPPLFEFLGVDGGMEPDMPGALPFDDVFVLSEAEREWIIESTRPILERLGYEPDAWSTDVPIEHQPRTDAFPERRLGVVPPSLDAVELARIAVAEARHRGFQRVGLFGAGYLSHLICPHLTDLAGDIDCLFDENPMLVGRELAGWSIQRPERAQDLGVQAVIPVTLVHQSKMTERWRRWYGNEIPVVPLWPEVENTELPASLAEEHARVVT